MPRKQYAYHGTTVVTLRAIIAKGLQVELHEAYKKPVIWFTDDSLGAASYGDIVLRFPFPTDAVFDDDPRGFGQYVTFRNVPPEKIEVWDRDDGWVASTLFL